jgi:hypothetical protein
MSLLFITNYTVSLHSSLSFIKTFPWTARVFHANVCRILSR